MAQATKLEILYTNSRGFGTPAVATLAIQHPNLPDFCSNKIREIKSGSLSNIISD